MKQTILVTGGGGYIGSVLCGQLLDAGYNVTCVDRFFFGEQTVAEYKDRDGFKLVRADIRRLDAALFQNVYAVIDLAGLSNDPACDLSEDLTESINYHGAINVARLAKQAGVPRLIYASSCSVYGHAKTMPVTETSPCLPVSLYAKCKLRVEQDLTQLADANFCVTFLRFATVYGRSPRMRFDLIINIMTMFAYTQHKIIVLGGGNQWRPVVHVNDVGTVIGKVLTAPTDKINREIYNVGSDTQNYRVIDVARRLQEIIPNVIVDIAPDDADKRSYNVNFSKLAAAFTFAPAHDITSTAHDIIHMLQTGIADPADPRTSTSKYYKYLIEAEQTLKTVILDGQLI
jgi:nucleoside-diphosphate-sugar epimerase